jgi:hypothetical protein
MNKTVNIGKQEELYLQVINTKSTIVAIPMQLRMRKRCSIAAIRDNNVSQKERNLKVEMAYMSTLKKVKSLFAQCAHPIFERNYRKDNSESALAMHAYLTNSFYFYLECDFLYNYQVEYALNNCPYVSEIRVMLNDFPFGINAKEVTLKPDFTMFYLNVLKVQDKKHITY